MATANPVIAILFLIVVFILVICPTVGELYYRTGDAGYWRAVLNGIKVYVWFMVAAALVLGCIWSTVALVHAGGV